MPSHFISYAHPGPETSSIVPGTASIGRTNVGNVRGSAAPVLVEMRVTRQSSRPGGSPASGERSQDAFMADVGHIRKGTRKYAVRRSTSTDEVRSRSRAKYSHSCSPMGPLRPWNGASHDEHAAAGQAGNAAGEGVGIFGRIQREGRD